jgi:signal transduction histidine kinase
MSETLDLDMIESSETTSTITIQSKQFENSTALIVRDNGIGISAEDINRVFDKGFTGANGRQFARSTGMGLYLCRKLCLKLGLNITIQSKYGEYTEVTIIFPKGTMYSLV